jgi:hypothetical protein
VVGLNVTRLYLGKRRSKASQIPPVCSVLVKLSFAAPSAGNFEFMQMQFIGVVVGATKLQLLSIIKRLSTIKSTLLEQSSQHCKLPPTKELLRSSGPHLCS